MSHRVWGSRASKDTLVEVAAQMRQAHQPPHPRAAFWSALADWLAYRARARHSTIGDTLAANEVALTYRDAETTEPAKAEPNLEGLAGFLVGYTAYRVDPDEAMEAAKLIASDYFGVSVE